MGSGPTGEHRGFIVSNIVPVDLPILNLGKIRIDEIPARRYRFDTGSISGKGPFVARTPRGQFVGRVAGHGHDIPPMEPDVALLVAVLTHPDCPPYVPSGLADALRRHAWRDPVLLRLFQRGRADVPLHPHE